MKSIDCEKHGTSRYSIICAHLRGRDGLGYFAFLAEATEPARAWCEAGAVVLAQERGWTDRADSHAGWKPYCATCHENRLRAQALISRVEGTAPETAQATVAGIPLGRGGDADDVARGSARPMRPQCSKFGCCADGFFPVSCVEARQQTMAHGTQ